MTDKPEDEIAGRVARAAAASRARRIGGRAVHAQAKNSAPEDVAVEDVAVEDVAVEDVAVEDVAVEDVAVEDVAPDLAPAAAEPPRAEPAAPVRPRPGPKPAPVSTTKPPRPTPPKPAAPTAQRAGLTADWLPAGVLAAIALAFAILIAVFSISGGSSGNPTQQRNQIREQVLAAAKTCTARENTYNYKTMANDEKAALACTTGDFYTAVKATFDKVLVPKAPGVQQVQLTTIDLAAVERISENGKEWTILVFGQNSVTNTTTGATTPRLDPFAAQVTMTKVGSKWLISRLDYA